MGYKRTNAKAFSRELCVGLPLENLWSTQTAAAAMLLERVLGPVRGAEIGLRNLLWLGPSVPEGLRNEPAVCGALLQGPALP